jgi:hypothetical protein
VEVLVEEGVESPMEVAQLAMVTTNIWYTCNTLGMGTKYLNPALIL